MAVKVKEKEIAIELRRQGYSYSEILKRVPVAKSTLSLWLRSLGLAKQQKQRLTEKRLAALKRGWEACSKEKNSYNE
jgi:transposase